MDPLSYSPLKSNTVGNVLGFAALVIAVIWVAKKLPYLKTVV